MNPMKMDFKENVFRVVANIPEGKTLTYKEVARQVGRPKAYRAVGNILNKNYDSDIPCHRVVRSDGSTGGYNRGVEKKVKILKQEFNKINELSKNKHQSRGLVILSMADAEMFEEC